MTDEVLDALEALRGRRTHPHLCTPGCPGDCDRFEEPVTDPDVEKLVDVLVEVRKLHVPHRTHDLFSNPDFYYEVCVNCAGADGEWYLWPCPTGQALERLAAK